MGRLQYLQRMGLLTEQRTGVWTLHSNVESTLSAMGERGDIIRTMQRAMSGKQRELAVFQTFPSQPGSSIVPSPTGSA